MLRAYPALLLCVLFPLNGPFRTRGGRNSVSPLSNVAGWNCRRTYGVARDRSGPWGRRFSGEDEARGLRMPDDVTAVGFFFRLL